MAARLRSRTLLSVARSTGVLVTSVFIALLVVGLWGINALAASSLPGGASSLQETYQDWQVRCVNEEDGPNCRLVQRQVHRETGQLLLAVELMTTELDGLSGTIALPLGLRLGAGVTFLVDDGEPSSPLPFSTCLPEGCLVPIAPDEVVTAQLREGETLKLVAGLLDGRAIHFTVSLNGFAAALDRLWALEAGM